MTPDYVPEINWARTNVFWDYFALRLGFRDWADLHRRVRKNVRWQ